MYKNFKDFLLEKNFIVSTEELEELQKILDESIDLTEEYKIIERKEILSYMNDGNDEFIDSLSLMFDQQPVDFSSIEMSDEVKEQLKDLFDTLEEICSDDSTEEDLFIEETCATDQPLKSIKLKRGTFTKFKE